VSEFLIFDFGFWIDGEEHNQRERNNLHCCPSGSDNYESRERHIGESSG
jgi:hypothetical protein